MMKEIIRSTAWWDKYFLTMAEHVSTASKDPSTKVGCVIVRKDKTVASTGFNGFPRGMPDNVVHLYNREDKYVRIIHAEMNALQNAHERLEGCTLYLSPIFTCSQCAIHIINSGIARVVGRHIGNDRWKESVEKSMQLYEECGVEYKFITGHEV